MSEEAEKNGDLAAQSMLFQDPSVSRALPDKVFFGTTLSLCFKEPDVPDETYIIPNTNEESNPLKDSSALAVQRSKLLLNGGSDDAVRIVSRNRVLKAEVAIISGP